jgi:molybdenum cofactor cytidylyltransferase
MGMDKALLPWPPVTTGMPATRDTFLSVAIQSFLLTTDFVVVVAGKNETTVAPIAYAEGASIAVNPDPSRGQFSSLQISLREVLSRGRDAAIITLVDRPTAAAATIRTLREAFETSDESIWAIIPEFSGRHGHPFIAGRELIEAFLQAPPTSSAREVEHRCQNRLMYIAVDDPCVAMNINTPDDYAKLSTSSL